MKNSQASQTHTPTAWYYYLHTNGDLIGKNPVVVDSDPEYFNSPFVKNVWLIDTSDRETLYRLVLESLALGADGNRMKELCSKWGTNYDDTIEMLKRCKPSDLMKKGMDRFIQEILGVDIEAFWKAIENGGKKAIAAAEKGE